MKCATVLCLAVVSFLWAGSTAGGSEISWGYNFTASPHLTWIGGSNKGAIILPGTGVSDDKHGNSEVSTKLWTLSSASAGNPQKVEDKPFALVLNVHDKASGINGAATFTGAFNGTIWSSGSTLQPTFNSAVTETLHLGHEVYDISYKSFTPPSGNGAKDFGQIVFEVRVHHNPEPSALVLAVIGTPLLGLTLRRRVS